MTVDSDCLLSNPLSSHVRAEVRINRITAQYENKSEKFRGVDKQYGKQFHLTYSQRLHMLEPMIIQQAKNKFGQEIKVYKVSELREENQEPRTEDILVVGTIFKQEENRPSILKEYAEQSEDKVDVPEAEKEKYTSENDSLILEDDTMRVNLIGKVNPHIYVNGVVVGAWGREARGGNFRVKELIFPLIPAVKTEGEDVELVVVSGLDLIGDDCGDYLESCQLAVDWICGAAGGPQDHNMASKVERVVFAGNSLAESTMNKKDNTRAKYLTANKEAGSIAAIRQLDELMAQLAGSVNVDLVPGYNDPASGILPQQPLHKCMFPKTRVYPTFQSVTNPYSFTCAGRDILIVAGQTVHDVMRNSNLDNPLEILELFIRWGHVAPTCPDTLGCFPTNVIDPQTITCLPDVLIAGNQESLGWRKIEVNGKEVLLITLSRFGINKTLISINMKTLEPQELQFDCLIDEASVNSSPEK